MADHYSHQRSAFWPGVWISSDFPLDENEGAYDDRVLAVDMRTELRGRYEVSEEGKTYREWIVPADLINAQAAVTPLSEDEMDQLTVERWEGRQDD